MVPLCVHGLYTVKPVLMDTSINQNTSLSQSLDISLYVLNILAITNTSNVYNRQMICAREALIRLMNLSNTDGYQPGLTSKEAMFV